MSKWVRWTRSCVRICVRVLFDKVRRELLVQKQTQSEFRQRHASMLIDPSELLATQYLEIFPTEAFPYLCVSLSASRSYNAQIGGTKAGQSPNTLWHPIHCFEFGIIIDPDNVVGPIIVGSSTQLIKRNLKGSLWIFGNGKKANGENAFVCHFLPIGRLFPKSVPLVERNNKLEAILLNLSNRNSFFNGWYQNTMKTSFVYETPIIFWFCANNDCH